MKFVSFNVNGLRSILKKTFIEDFTNMNADIFSLNETKLSDDNFPFLPEGYNVYHTFSKSHHLVRLPVRMHVQNSFP